MTYYEILGVSKSASQEEIRTAYKQLIKKYHPDLYQGDKAFAERKTQEINEAYDILSDSTKKYDYDLSITPSYTTTNTTNYSYTPPKYSSEYNPYSSYNNYYRNRYSSKYNSNTRSQPNNNYYKKTDKREVIYDEFSKKLGANFAVILFVFIIYLIIFIATIIQFKSFQSSHKYNKPTVNINTNTSNHNNSTEEFDINDYFSDSDLLRIYNENYRDIFDTFEEFKKAYSVYLQTYYDF